MKKTTIADVFAEAAERARAKAEAQRLADLPTETDRRRFLEAARGLLDADPNLRRSMSSRARSLLMRADLGTSAGQRTVTTRLREAGNRVVEDRLLDDVARGDREAGYRILMAYIAEKGRLTDSRTALQQATLLLHEIWRSAESARRAKDGAKRPMAKAPAAMRQERDLVALIQVDARDWRKRHPQGPRTEFARWCLAKHRKGLGGRWRSVESFRNWLYRKRVEI